MPDPLTCPQCGRALPASAPLGLCARCLLEPFLDPEDPDADLLPCEAGQSFGGYELLGAVARGGMGVVYRARQRSTQRIVALKMIRLGELAGDAELQRFHGETEAAARLDHPHIVPIHEVGEVEGQPFFTMRLLEGGTLADRLEAARREKPEVGLPRPMAAAEAVDLLIKVARAIHYAHQRGVLHRDLKPGNILLDEAGEPYVTDFGLAKLVDTPHELTLSGAALGSPNYMAPEQAAGRSREITVGADVYSLGAIFYELLTGQAPFQAATALAIMRQVMDDPPQRPSKIHPRVDRDLETICLQCLEKEPARRYASAERLAEDLERWRKGEPIRARAVPLWERGLKWARRRPAWAAFGFLAAIAPAVIIGVLLAANARVRSQREDTRSNLYAADVYMAQRALEDGNVGLARMALEAHRPRGSELDLRGFEWRYLWEQSRSHAVAVLTGHTYRVTCLDFSPGGEVLATGSHDQTVRLWEVPSGAALGEIQPGLGHLEGLSFSPDGGLLALSAGGGRVGLWQLAEGRLVWEFVCPRLARIFFVPGTTTVAVHEWGEPSAEAKTLDGRPHFVRFYDWAAAQWMGGWEMTGDLEAVAADGRTVATTAHFPEGRDGSKDWVELRDAASGSLRRSVPLSAFFLVLSPDGERVAAGGFSRKEIQLTGRSDVPQIHALLGHGDRVNGLAFSADGVFLASAGADHTVRVWDVDGAQESQRLLGHESEVWGVRFSPDGQLLASGAENGRVHLWAVKGPTRAKETTRLYPPFVLSPCGNLLAALRGKDAGDPAKQSVVRDLVTGEERVLGEPGELGPACFANGGRSLTLVERGVDGLCRLQQWDLESGKRHPAVTLEESGAEFHHFAGSPDGAHFAAGCADGRVRLWRAESGGLETLEPGTAMTANYLTFSHNGRILAACHLRSDGLWALNLYDLPFGRSRFTAEGAGSRRDCLAFSPDGRLFAVATGEGVVEIRDSASGALVDTLSDRRAAISWVDFSADGRTLATTYAGPGGALKLWHLPTRREVAVLHRGDTCPRWICFAPDGERLIGVDWLGAQHLYRAPPLPEIDADE